jgi:predicted acyltransferase
MFIAGLIGVVIGYSMRPFIPIIERISTSSYVIVTGGWAVIAMSISYLLVDVLKFRKAAKFFAIFGMNSIFLYLLAELGGGRIFHRMATPFTSRLFVWGGEIVINMITIVVVAAMFWYLSFFLYKRKIFFKL